MEEEVVGADGEDWREEGGVIIQGFFQMRRNRFMVPKPQGVSVEPYFRGFLYGSIQLSLRWHTIISLACR